MSKTRIAQILSTNIWALTPAKLDEVGLFVEALLLGRTPGWDASNGVDLEAATSPAGPASGPYLIQRDGTAVIRVEGVIERRANMVGNFSGGTSTQMIAQSIVDVASHEDVSSIVLDIDSPGGSALAPAEVADAIVMVREYGVPVIAWTGGQMCSAAYWIASYCDAIVAMPTSIVGSIGVAAVHYDRSAKDAKDGVTRTVLSAGAYKRIASDEKALSDEGRAYLQAQIDTYYTLFVDAVAQGRGITAQAVLEGMADGRIFIGSEALKAGLVDHIGNFEMALEVAREKRRSTMTKQSDGKPSQLSGVTLETLTQERPDLIEQIAATANADGQAALTDAIAQATNAERLRVVEILEAEGDQAVTMAAIKDGTPAASVFKLLYQAQTKAKADALDGVQKAMGQSAGAAGQAKADRDPADSLSREQQLADKTRAHLAANPGLSFEHAVKAVLAANPDLAIE